LLVVGDWAGPLQNLRLFLDSAENLMSYNNSQRKYLDEKMEWIFLSHHVFHKETKHCDIKTLTANTKQTEFQRLLRTTLKNFEVTQSNTR
jgi:hypothetical protein